MLNIIQKRKYFYTVSLVFCILSVIAFGMWGLNTGIDFKGGTLLEVEFSDRVPEKKNIETALAIVELKSLSIQQTGEKGLIIRYLASEESTNEKVVEKLKNLDSSVLQKRVDFVGAAVSKQLTEKAVQAVMVATIAIALFIAWSFRKVSRPVPSWQYGLGAIIALVHDIIIVIGVFSVLGKYVGTEVGVPFIAALLTILGYSINDTIVVYDRTRENLLRYGAKEGFESIVNRSLNETLTRSVNTSMTVILVLLAITVFGGESMRYFTIALLVGVIVGTYSSIYIASAMLVTNYKLLKRNS